MKGYVDIMTRSELIGKIATKNPQLYMRDIEAIIETIITEMSDALANDDRVELRGFGSFVVKKRAPRTGRNPRTGETVDVAAKSLPAFKAGKALRDRLNEE